MPDIPLELIDVPDDTVRTLPASQEADAGLSSSIAELGVLAPILLRPNGNSRYWLICGRRRLRAARDLGFKQIPAYIAPGFREDKLRLAQFAENLARAPMAPVDQWRTMVELCKDGWTLPAAAAALGISERQARKLDKLGRLHPDLLACIEQGDMPDEDKLGRIAAAPPDVQARALKAALKDHDGINWWRVCSACRVDAIGRGRAIFDTNTSDVVFEEDLFAEPGRELWFTTNVAGFLTAQREALKADVAKQKGEKRRIEYVETDKQGNAKLPKGWATTFGNPDKPKRDETVFCSVVPSSYNVGEIVRITAKKAAADPKKTKGKSDAKAEDHGSDGDDVEADSDVADEKPARPDTRPARMPGAAPPEPTSRDPISKSGQSLIANAKTLALHRRLETGRAGFSPEHLLAFLVLALGARTVTVTSGSTGYTRIDMRDLATQLVPPEGATGLQLDMAHGAAIQALTRLLFVPLVDQPADPVPEWIGHAIGADAELPRFDTEGFLPHVTGSELKRLAIGAGEKPAKTVEGLRAQLVGRLHHWRPASFGASGPKSKP